jgi:replicative DNA helicase
MESRSLDEQLGPDAIAELEANEAADPAARLAAGRIGALLPEALDLFDARRDGRDRPVPVPWKSVADALGGGLWAGMHVLTGGTGAGKSQWALQVGLEAARNGVPVLYVGLELDAPGIVARLLAMLAKARDGKGFPWSALYTGRDRDHNGALRPHELGGRVAELADELRGLPIHCVFGGPMGFAPDELRALGKALRAEHPDGPALVVFDFLQLVGDPEGERLELRERIRWASYQGRALARELALSVVMVSSVAREHYGKIGGLAKSGDDKAPKLGDAPAALLVGLGKESGEIEYSADSVLCLAADEYDDDERGRPVWLAVAKLRAGHADWCSLRFNGQTFADDPRRADDARRLARMPKASEPKASRAKDRLK